MSRGTWDSTMTPAAEVQERKAANTTAPQLAHPAPLCKASLPSARKPLL